MRHALPPDSLTSVTVREASIASRDSRPRKTTLGGQNSMQVGHPAAAERMSEVEERERLAALHDLNILDTAPEERFDRLTRLAQRLFDVPIVAVSLIDRDRQWFKSKIGLTADETDRRDAFCNHSIRSGDPLVIPDAERDDRFSANPFVTGAPKIRFYAAQPLQAPGGHRVGALCLIDDHPRQMDEGQLALLRELADWVETELVLTEELRKASEVQRELLPRSAPDVRGYQVAGACLPARELGGDFYDWYFVGDRLQVTLADVMGKGIPAAIIASGVRALLRGATRFNEVGEAVNRAAFALREDLDQTSTFVTLFTARLDPVTGELGFVDAGHGLAMIVTSEGAVRRLASEDLPLGAMSGAAWHEHCAELAPGETFVLVSDGLLDLYDTPPEVLQAVCRLSLEAGSAQQLVDAILTVARRGKPADDVTAVVIRRQDL